MSAERLSQLLPAPRLDDGLWKLKDHGADQVFQLHYKECSGTDQDRLRYWARARVREKCKGHAGVDGAGGVCVDGPVSRTYRAVAAETECCYCWMKGSLLGS